MAVRVAINGFGRIGRNILRAAIKRGADLEVVLINDVDKPKTLAHLCLFHDQFIHRKFVVMLSVRDRRLQGLADLFGPLGIAEELVRTCKPACQCGRFEFENRPGYILHGPDGAKGDFCAERLVLKERWGYPTKGHRQRHYPHPTHQFSLARKILRVLVNQYRGVVRQFQLHLATTRSQSDNLSRN